MKTPNKILLSVLLFLQVAAYGQNSTCGSPSGAMQQPNDPLPTCFTGFSGPGSGPLTQYYTFVATTANMAVQLTPVLGTSCSFPNTGINYSGFALYSSADCFTVLGTSPNMSGLTVGEMYTFGLTMSPQDPVCVWISEACPRVVEVVVPLPVSSLFLNGWEDRGDVTLAWEVGTGVEARGFVVKRRTGSLAGFEEVGTVAVETPTLRYGWRDEAAPAGRSEYQVDVLLQNGERACSEVVSVSVEGEQELVVSPNPCHDRVVVQLPEGDGQMYEVVVCGLDGSVVRSLHGPGTNLNAALSGAVAELSPGMYVIRAYDGRRGSSTRLVKE